MRIIDCAELVMGAPRFRALRPVGRCLKLEPLESLVDVTEIIHADLRVVEACPIEHVWLLVWSHCLGLGLVVLSVVPLFALKLLFLAVYHCLLLVLSWSLAIMIEAIINHFLI